MKLPPPEREQEFLEIGKDDQELLFHFLNFIWYSFMLFAVTLVTVPPSGDSIIGVLSLLCARLAK
tara:strand:+ start:756 stop:950 length:195 start_codon:yes stop_codon:yes gene_type:complete